MAKRYTLSVHDMSRNKLCELYDSQIQTEGEPYDVQHTEPIGDIKSITFTLPRIVNGEVNWRAAYMTNDYLLRWGVDGAYDWFVIDEPEDSHTGKKSVISVSARHISSLLNRKNLYGAFDDTNGIDTCGNLITKALSGSGWTLGTCDTFYESDGTTEKIRSYTCNEKTATYSMIAGICELFYAYPVFNGDAKTVDIHALSNYDGMMEVIFGKNLDSIARKRTSGDLITRLYVEGDYSQDSYVGIENATANTSGLPFILNFDYYREIGQFTQTHEDALTAYLSAMASAQAAITSAATSEQAALTSLAEKWGSSDFVLYTVSGGTATFNMKTAGATDDDKVLSNGDVVAAVQSYQASAYKYSYITIGTDSWPANTIYAVKFLGPVAGTLGGYEVSVEAKTTTVATLTSKISASSSDVEKASLTSEKTAQETAIAAMNTTRWSLMYQCIQLALSIGGYMSTIATNQAAQETAEATFEAAMGDMLKSGTWNDKNYVAGQEDSLYADALEVAAEMSRPQYEYTLSILDLSSLTNHAGEEFKINQKVRVYDEATGINDIAFVSKVVTKPRLENQNVIELSTDERNVTLKSFTSLINRIMEQADIVKERQSIYDRARALSGDGTLATEKLNGEINLLKHKIGSSASGIYTDENGNMIIEAADGSSAMMLTGAGFMLAADKDGNGEWNWRAFGTGEGFTADMITAGILRAGVITILGSDQFYWDADNIYICNPTTANQNVQAPYPPYTQFIAIGKYDGTNYGIGYTTDGGLHWQNAIGFSGITLNATDELRLSTAEAQIAAVPGEISLAVNNLKVGGTNIVPRTGWYSNFDGWVFTQPFILYPASSGNAEVTDTFDGNGFIHWNQPSSQRDAYSSMIPVTAGDVLTYSFRFRGSGLKVILAGYNSSSTQIWGPEQTYAAGVTQDFASAPLTVPANVVRVRLYFRVSASTAGVLGRIKLEHGNKATAWSPAPADPAESVVNGSTIALTDERILLQAPEVYINVSGTSGDLMINDTGVSAENITSPSVAERYKGPTSITVNTSGTPSTSVYKTLGDAFSALSNKWIPETVTITLATNTTEAGTAVLEGVVGKGSVNVNLNGKTISGRIAIRNSATAHAIEGGYVTASGSDAIISIERCSMVYIGNITITGSGQAASGVAAWYSRIVVEGDYFYNLARCILSTRLSNVEFVNNYGSNNNYCLKVHDGGRVAWKGYVPTYTNGIDNTDLTGIVTPSSLPGGSGGGSTPPSPPATTTTITAGSGASTPVVTRTYQPNGSGWILSGSNVSSIMYIGQDGTGINYNGAIWFDTSNPSWTGKTIVAAKLTLHCTNVNSGGRASVYMKTISNSVPSSSSTALANATDYGLLGTIARNETLTFELPVAAIQAISSNNNAKALLLYGSGRSDYATFSGGSNTTYRPQLTVTYSGT